MNEFDSLIKVNCTLLTISSIKLYRRTQKDNQSLQMDQATIILMVLTMRLSVLSNGMVTKHKNYNNILLKLIR